MLIHRVKTVYKSEGGRIRYKYLVNSWWLFGIIPLYITYGILEEK